MEEKDIWREDDEEEEKLKKTLDPRYLRLNIDTSQTHPTHNNDDVLPSR
jgi:hypothetical protein